MANRRLLGVFGDNLPTKKGLTVNGSDFLVGGIVGFFERKFNTAYVVRSPQEAASIFGQNVDSSSYGWDAVNGFFANVVGVDAKLYISSHVGYTGSAIDAVTASQNLSDGTPASVLTITDAYAGDPGYGVSGNRTGVTVTNGDRFLTTVGTTGTASDTFAILTSVAGVKVGDLMKFTATGGGGAVVWKKITSVDELVKKVFWSGVFHATASLAATDVCSVRGFRLRVWRKAVGGAVTEVDTDLGSIYCTTEPEVAQFYAPNVFGTSAWIKVVRNSTTPATLDKTPPVDVAAPVFPVNGANGTAPTTAAHWSYALARFDNMPVRVMANPETSTAAIQQAMETYCKGRRDNPKVLYTIPENQTKAQLITIGQSYQRSDDVLGVLVANWLYVSDPFNNTPNAPYRHVPNVGHVMGAWLRSIGLRGVHYLPATKDNPLYGAIGVIGDQLPADTDRTDVSDYGVNMIQQLSGYGVVVRNFFTPSTAVEFSFANGIMLREYIKVSAVNSLQLSENTPNSFERIQEDRSAILQFLYQLWQNGSSQSVPPGETFGQTLNADGTATRPEQHFEVQADLVNNPLNKIQQGERNLFVYFTYPAPAGSIKIGTGIMLLG